MKKPIGLTLEKGYDKDAFYRHTSLKKKNGAAPNPERYFGRKKGFVHRTELKRVSNSFQFSEPFWVRYRPLEKIRKSVQSQ